MATKRKTTTKKDLEAKIANLEAKLSKLSTQVGAKSAPKPAKPAEVKPAPKPEPTKPAESKPAPKPEPTKPAEPKPKPAEAKPPATFQDALENAYRTAPMSDFHQYRAKVTGYAPAPNRYFVRLTAPVGTVPTSNWNDQKVHVTGYTQPSNQYFATRARLAYHPPDKTFGSFSSSTMNVQGVELKPQTQAPPPPASKPDAALPKETQPSSSSKSKQESLEEYEADYLKRLEDAKIADEKAYQEAVEEETKHRASTTHGSLPKGFSSAAPEPEKPKASKGTLPKGF